MPLQFPFRHPITIRQRQWVYWQSSARLPCSTSSVVLLCSVIDSVLDITRSTEKLSDNPIDSISKGKKKAINRAIIVSIINLRACCMHRKKKGGGVGGGGGRVQESVHISRCLVLPGTSYPKSIKEGITGGIVRHHQAPCSLDGAGYLTAFLTIFLRAASPRSTPHMSERRTR